VASSGGSGVLLSDKCVSAGLEVVPFTEITRKKLDEILPSFGSSANPVDTTSQILVEPDLLLKPLKVVLDDTNIDMVIYEHWPGLARNFTLLDGVIEAANATEKTLMVFMLGSELLGREEFQYLRTHRVPVVRTQDRAVRVLGHVTRYSRRIKEIRAAKDIKMPLKDIDSNRVKRLLEGTKPGQALSESLSKQILLAYGIPLVPEGSAQDLKTALKIAHDIGFPVAIKIDSPDIQHKTDAGGVKLNINTDQELGAAFAEIIENVMKYKPGVHLNGITVQKMLKGGTECIIGVKNDEVFGPTILFGLGGVFVEALEDFSLRVCPITPLDAREMVSEIRGHRLLTGFRGAPPADREAIYDVILRVSQLAMDFKELKEIDINPLVVFQQGVCAADALMIM
jgi:acetyltransferase